MSLFNDTLVLVTIIIVVVIIMHGGTVAACLCLSGMLQLHHLWDAP